MYSVSFIIPTLNSERLLEKCLKSVRGQKYPQNKTEILIVDGGSTDKTHELAAKYNCKFISGGYKENQEARKGVGLHKAVNELVIYIDSDNSLPTKNWVSQMIQPFLDYPNLVGAETWRYAWVRQYTPAGRYCALFGVNDPVAFYLHKADKISWLENKWSASPIILENEKYLITKFNEKNLPTIGGNGFVAKRELLLKAKCSPEEFFHIDVNFDLIKLGFDTFAMVKNEINHDTAKSVSHLTNRRKKYYLTHNIINIHRRYYVFDHRRKQDIKKILLFILYSVTIIQPLALSIKGFIKKRDYAWFLHPIMCLAFLYTYTTGFIVLSFRNIFIKLVKNQLE